MNRRDALSLIALLPLAAKVEGQTRATARHRLALSRTVGLLLNPDGTLNVWGSDPGASHRTAAPAADRMGLGHNNPVDKFALYAVPNVRGVVSAAASTTACYAVLIDGTVIAWGSNGSGELGITSLAEFQTGGQARAGTRTPTPVAVTVNAVDVSAKGDHVLALMRDGAVFSWGRGDSGQLGIGPLPSVNFKTRSARVEPYMPYPVRVPGLEAVAAISAGDRHSLALMKDGSVRAWGLNRYGQLGDGTTQNRNQPTTVAGVRNAVAIAAGGNHSVALLADGTALEWGGSYVNLTPRPAPALVPGARGLKSVVAGDGHTAALTQTGEVMTWGQDAHYETGRGSRANAAGLVQELSNVSSLAAAASTTIAVLASGRMMTWGEVRPWTRPGSGQPDLSPYPIRVWLDGLDTP